MSTNNLLQQQREIILRSRSIIDDYERKKSDVETRVKQENETAESTWNREKGIIEEAWKHDKETIENNWNRTRTQADSALQAVRNSVQSAQDVLKTAKWQDELAGGIPSTAAIPTSSSLLNQIELYQSASEKASREIHSLLNGFGWRSWQGVVAGTSGFIIAIVLLISLTSIMDGYLADATRSWVLMLSCALLFISFSFLIYSIIYTLRARLILPRLKVASATLLQAGTRIEDLYKRVMDPREMYQPQMVESQTRYRSSIEQVNQAYQRLLAERQARYTEMMRQLDQKFADDVASLRYASTAFMHEAGLQGLSWDDPEWRQWQPSQTTTTIVRLGTLTTELHQVIPPLPAFIGCPGGENLLFRAAGDAKNTATSAIQSLLLRLLATQPSGKIRFTLIDPVGLGQNVATFMQLADYDEKLVNSRAWTESRHIEQQLAALSEHMENVIQKYLRGQYTTIEEYNKQAGEVAEPYRILVVMGFPVNFTEDTARRLVKITTSGPRCGVSTIVMMDTEQPLPYGFNLADLERVATVIAWDGQRFVWRDKDFENCRLKLDTPPSLDLFNRLLEEVGRGTKAASEVKVPFERIAPPKEEWWKGSTREGLKVSLGRAGATKLQYLDLGKSTAQHALVAGKTGSGKTTLLHILITNLALTYSPDELELYLVDFKTVGFTPYATYKLPHARVVAIQSEREFGLSVLQGLDTELERRKNIFSKAGVQDIVQYRGTHPNVRMPRILLLVDEFQEFFTQDDKVAQDASLLLDRLVRQGRAFGIHIMLGSQTLAGAYTLARATIGQMAVRIALQCEEADSRLVLSDDNPAARLLSRPGEAIYNAANGLVEGNNPFQCSWLPDDGLDVYLGSIQRFAQQRRYVSSWKQIVFDGSKDADVAENPLLQDALKGSSWTIPQKALQAWLGDPIAIKDPTAFQIRSQAGNNLLIVGQQEEAALGMLITALLSLTTQHTPGTARFYVVDFSPGDATYAGLLDRIGQMLPHRVKVVNRRGLLSAITDIADEVQDRMEADGESKLPIYLFIYGLQRARDLRPDEDFSYSSFGSEAPTTSSPAKQFSTLLREGPELGVHTLTWCDTLTNLNRTLERGALREFEARVVFQMSQEDSLNLVDSPAASRLGPHRALLFSEETGRVEKFRPYGLPTEEWLQQAATYIRQKR